MASIIKVDTIQDQDGNNIINENANVITVGASGDTVNIVGTLQNNGAAIPGDISSVVAGTGLSGGGTTGDVTLNIEAAQPTITSTGTLTNFTSTGIDDNATSTAITINSSGNVGIGLTNPVGKLDVTKSSDTLMNLHNPTDTSGSQARMYLGAKSNPPYQRGVALVGELNSDFSHNMQFWVSSSSGAGPTEKMRIDSSGNVIIGATTAQAKLHIVKTDVGALNDSNANTLMIEHTNAGLTIGSSTTGEGAIHFSDSDDADVGKIQYAHSSNLMTFRTNGANRMFIDSSGNVGIGTSSPDCKLEVDAGTTASVFAPAMIITSSTGGAGGATPIDLRHSTNSSSGFRIQIAGSAGSNNAILNLIENSAMIFATNNAERMRITSAGQVAIGTTGSASGSRFVIDNPNPNGTSEVGWGIDTNGGGYWAYTNGNTYWNNTGVGDAYINIRYKGNTVGSIKTGTTNVAYNTTSDYRLKNNISNVLNAIDRVKQLKPIRFSFIVEPDKIVDGFLAHEVQEVVPEAITGTKDATETYIDEQGNEQTKPLYQAIDQSKLVPLLTAGLQEAIAKIETLEARITALENN